MPVAITAGFSKLITTMSNFDKWFLIRTATMAIALTTMSAGANGWALMPPKVFIDRRHLSR